MSRPTILELYEIDAKKLPGMIHKDVIKLKLDKAYSIKQTLVYRVQDLGKVTGNYEFIAPIQNHIKYLDKTITGLMAEINEMGINYERA